MFTEEKEMIKKVAESFRIKLKEIVTQLSEQEDIVSDSMMKVQDLEHQYDINENEEIGNQLEKAYEEHDYNMNVLGDLQYAENTLTDTISDLERVMNRL